MFADSHLCIHGNHILAETYYKLNKERNNIIERGGAKRKSGGRKGMLKEGKSNILYGTLNW